MCRGGFFKCLDSDENEMQLISNFIRNVRRSGCKFGGLARRAWVDDFEVVSLLTAENTGAVRELHLNSIGEIIYDAHFVNRHRPQDVGSCTSGSWSSWAFSSVWRWEWTHLATWVAWRRFAHFERKTVHESVAFKLLHRFFKLESMFEQFFRLKVQDEIVWFELFVELQFIRGSSVLIIHCDFKGSIFHETAFLNSASVALFIDRRDERVAFTSNGDFRWEASNHVNEDECTEILLPLSLRQRANGIMRELLSPLHWYAFAVWSDLHLITGRGCWHQVTASHWAIDLHCHRSIWTNREEHIVHSFGDWTQALRDDRAQSERMTNHFLQW